MRTLDPSDAVWRKSSYSGPNGECVEIAHFPDGVAWRESSSSSPNGACVELARIGAYTATRDSKNPDGPVLLVPTPAWQTFLSGQV